MVTKSLAAALLMAMAAMAADTPKKAVTFNKDVLPILQKNCQTCHRPGQIAPMSLLTYKSARPWAKAMKFMVTTRKMPPWNADPQYGHFSNDRSLKQSDIDTIAAWADQGGPEGKAKDKPAPVQWPEAGWQIQPDIIVNGPETAVPAKTKNGVIEWSNVVVPSGFTKDTWVTSIEIRPSEIAVTHHICVLFMPHRPDVVYNVPEWRDVKRDEKGAELPRVKGEARNPSGSRNIQGAGGNEGCYLPGIQPVDYRTQNAGKLVPAGTDIIFSVHYTPNGKEVVDRPQVGFTVAKEEPKRQWLTWSVHGLQDGQHFAIPPNDPSWAPPTGVITLLADAELVWLSPHMHLRGKDMTYTVIYPDGKSETVLNVPHFDFNWQLGDDPAQPIKLPNGSKIVVTGHFDNSTNNKFNPDPTQTVYYGDMVWEEMFGGFIGLIVDKGIDRKKILREDTPQRLEFSGG